MKHRNSCSECLTPEEETYEVTNSQQWQCCWAEPFWCRFWTASPANKRHTSELVTAESLAQTAASSAMDMAVGSKHFPFRGLAFDDLQNVNWAPPRHNISETLAALALLWVFATCPTASSQPINIDQLSTLTFHDISTSTFFHSGTQRCSEAQARVADLALVVSNALPKHTVMKVNLNDADRSPRNGNERLLFSARVN